MNRPKHLLLPSVAIIAITAAWSLAQTPKPLLSDAEYYPLAVGNTWIYRVKTLEPKPSSSTIKWRVGKVRESAKGKVYAVRPTPIEYDDDLMSLLVSPSGITEIRDDVPLLRFPLKAGAKWSSPNLGDNSTEEFGVISVNRPCHGGRFSFSDCLAIEESDTKTDLRVITMYARHVGPVSFHYFRVRAGKKILVQTLELTSYRLASGK